MSYTVGYLQSCLSVNREPRYNQYLHDWRDEGINQSTQTHCIIGHPCLLLHLRYVTYEWSANVMDTTWVSDDERTGTQSTVLRLM